MWPFPAAASAAAPGGIPSVTQTFPCLSTWIPCAKMNIPSPKLFTSLPVASNLSTTGSFDPAQVFAPHLSATQMDLPSRSISTALVDPHVLPSGIFAQFSIVAYGLGRSLTGWTLLWPPGFSVNIVNAVTIASASMILNRPDCDIAYPPLNDLLNYPQRRLGKDKACHYWNICMKLPPSFP